MSLSGKLDVFPLEEVLRLLARSQQNGCLRVDGEAAGRIYMESGYLTYATVESDEILRDRLVAAGVVTEEGVNRLDISRGSLAEALAPTASTSALTELVREHCVESLYRIRRPGEGHFEFVSDNGPRYATGQAFDVESIISDAERRASEWADIETVVPDLATPWHMVPEIDEESVNLSDTAWRFLAAMDGACSVETLADRLGMTRFQTARRMAEMARARLVEPVAAPTYESSYQTSDYEAPADTYEPAAHAAYTTETEASEPTADVAETPSVDPDRSWWSEAQQSDGSAAGTFESPADEGLVPDDEVPAPEPAQGEESFLETVFSELEKTEEPADEDESEDTGFGLLRRRGLGAAFRELADS